MVTWVDVAGWTLVHFVWQGAVIAAGAAIGFHLLRRSDANVRYLFASGALSLMLVSLVATAWIVSSPAAITPSSWGPTVVTPLDARIPLHRRVIRVPPAAAETSLQRLPRAFPVIVIAWLTGVAILLTRLLSGWWRVRAMQRTALAAPPSRWQAATNRMARRLGVRGGVRVSDADSVETPTVAGWWKPVIMLPVTALSGLTPSQADAVLAHELAHIRRHDYLVNLLQHVVETVLFYHPAVWWVSHRMRVEREQCCDAIVVDLCADPLDYADALTRLEEARRTTTGFAVAATGGTLIERVRRLLNARTDQHTPMAHAFVTATIIALVVVVVGGGSRWSSRTLQARDRGGQLLDTAARPARGRAILGSRRIQEIDTNPAPQIVAPKETVLPVTSHAEPAQSNADGQARPELATLDTAGPERQLEDALKADNPPSDMPLAVEVNYFMLNRAEYSVPLALRIPGSELALARSQGAARTTIDFLGEVKDAYETPIQTFRDRLDVRIGDEGVAELETRSIQYQTVLTLLPGRYSFRIVAREAETGRIGTFRTSFVIPNLNREENALPISTVVLGSQLVRMNETPTVRPDPLVYDGQKLIPSVTRVFSTSQDMYVFLQVYQRDATTTQPLVAAVTLYRGGVKALETVPLQVTEVPEGRSKAVSVRLSVPLGSLAPGGYECEVTVLDPAGQKVSSWRAPVTLVP